jgi:hypothetical protein
MRTFRSITRLSAAMLLMLVPRISRAQVFHGVSGVLQRAGTVNVADLPPSAESRTAVPRSHPVIPVPNGLPLPPGTDRTRAVPLVGPVSEWSSLQQTQGVNVAHSFAAIGDDNTAIPPDSQGAVGPTAIMVTLNSQVRVQSRSGTPLQTYSMTSFWSHTFPSVKDLTDPRVTYDPYGGRWIFVAITQPQSPSSVILLAVSSTNDPTGSWVLYQIQSDPLGQIWADNPKIGFNRKWIVIQANMYSVTAGGSGSFVESKIFAINKPEAYAGGYIHWTRFDEKNIGGDQMPLATYDASISDEFLIQDWNGNSSGAGYLRLWRITGAVGAEILVSDGFPSVSAPWSRFPPNNSDFGPQLGSSHKINLVDSRIQSACYRNGMIWTTHPVFLPAGATPTRSAVQWWKIDPVGEAVQVGRVDDPTSTYFYGFPSIAVNRSDDVLLGFSYFSANNYASAGFAYRASTDPAQTLSQPYILKSGQAPYYKTGLGDPAKLNRWGDLSEAVVDPNDDMGLWTIQEYAAARANGIDRWGTWWGEVSPAPLALPNLTPYQPLGWSDKIVVTTSQGSTTSADRITSSDTIFVDWAVINSGAGPVQGTFTNSLYLGAQLLGNWTVTGGLASGRDFEAVGYPMGPLSPGTYTLTIKANSTNSISESNSSDNSYSRSFIVEQACIPNGRPCVGRIGPPAPVPVAGRQ